LLLLLLQEQLDMVVVKCLSLNLTRRRLLPLTSASSPPVAAAVNDDVDDFFIGLKDCTGDFG